MARTDIQTSDDANYFAIATWSVWDDAQGIYQDFEGIFEYEKTYRLLIDVRPESGYYFSEDILFLINGAESTDTAIYGKGKYGEYTKEYSESLTVIDQVELTVEIPIPGQHTSAAPVVTLADGVTYTENSSQWMSVPEGGGSEPYDGYFSEGASYAVQTDLIAGEGTIFSEDMTVVLNGVALPQSFVTVTEKNCSVIYKFQLHTQEELTDLTEPIDLTESTDSTEPIDSTEPTDLPEPIDSTESTDSTEPTDSAEPIDSAEPTYSNSPQTGDNSNPWLWFALLIVSGAGIFGITVYDRCQRAAAGCSGDCQKEK